KRCSELCTPASAHGVNFDCLVRRPGRVIESGECHYATVSKRCHCRIPAPMRHVLDGCKYVCGRIVNCGSKVAMKRVILQSTAVDEDAPVGQNYHAIAEHIPAKWLRCRSTGLRVPNACLKVEIRRNVART